MHWLRIIAVLLLVALLQVTIVPAVAVRSARPDLMLLVAAYIGMREPPERGRPWGAFWVGWAAGVLVDIYSAGSHLPFGTTALVFGLMALGASRLGAELFLDSAIAQVLILAPVCLVVRGALAMAVVVFAGGSTRVELGQAFWTAMYSALVAPLVFAVMRSLERFLGIRSRRSFGRA